MSSSRPQMPRSSGGPLLSRIKKADRPSAKARPKIDEPPAKSKKPLGQPKAKEPHGLEYFQNRLKTAHGKMVAAARNVAGSKPRSKAICEMEPVIASYVGRQKWIKQNFDAQGTRITPEAVDKPRSEPWKRVWPKEGDSTFTVQRAKYDALKDIAFRSICAIVAEPESSEVIEVARKAVARFNNFRFIHKRQWTRNGEWKTLGAKKKPEKDSENSQ